MREKTIAKNEIMAVRCWKRLGLRYYNSLIEGRVEGLRLALSLHPLRRTKNWDISNTQIARFSSGKPPILCKMPGEASRLYPRFSFFGKTSQLRKD